MKTNNCPSHLPPSSPHLYQTVFFPSRWGSTTSNLHTTPGVVTINQIDPSQVPLDDPSKSVKNNTKKKISNLDVYRDFRRKEFEKHPLTATNQSVKEKWLKRKMTSATPLPPTIPVEVQRPQPSQSPMKSVEVQRPQPSPPPPPTSPASQPIPVIQPQSPTSSHHQTITTTTTTTTTTTPEPNFPTPKAHKSIPRRGITSCPTIEPTLEQMRHLPDYMNQLQTQSMMMHAGAIKVVPPKAWPRPKMPLCDRTQLTTRSQWFPQTQSIADWKRHEQVVVGLEQDQQQAHKTTTTTTTASASISFDSMEEKWMTPGWMNNVPIFPENHNNTSFKEFKETNEKKKIFIEKRYGVPQRTREEQDEPQREAEDEDHQDDDEDESCDDSDVKKNMKFKNEKVSCEGYTREEAERMFWDLIYSGPSPSKSKNQFRVLCAIDICVPHRPGYKPPPVYTDANNVVLHPDPPRLPSSRLLLNAVKSGDVAQYESWSPANINMHPTSLLYETPMMPGITQSMYYVGSTLSRFGWHIEDASLYSMSYLHCGATKVWYVIPPKYADKMKKLGHSIFHDHVTAQDPDCFDRKTTLFHPDLALENDIPVTIVEQTEGSFVVTAPRAYHCGFNMGVNVAEAVNVAWPHWLQFTADTFVQNSIAHKSYPIPFHWMVINHLIYLHTRCALGIGMRSVSMEHVRILANTVNNIIEFVRECIPRLRDKNWRLVSSVQHLNAWDPSAKERDDSYLGLECKVCRLLRTFPFVAVCNTCDETWCLQCALDQDCSLQKHDVFLFMYRRVSSIHAMLQFIIYFHGQREERQKKRQKKLKKMVKRARKQASCKTTLTTTIPQSFWDDIESDDEMVLDEIQLFAGAKKKNKKKKRMIPDDMEQPTPSIKRPRIEQNRVNEHQNEQQPPAQSQIQSRRPRIEPKRGNEHQKEQQPQMQTQLQVQSLSLSPSHKECQADAEKETELFKSQLTSESHSQRRRPRSHSRPQSRHNTDTENESGPLPHQEARSPRRARSETQAHPQHLAEGGKENEPPTSTGDVSGKRRRNYSAERERNAFHQPQRRSRSRLRSRLLPRERSRARSQGSSRSRSASPHQKAKTNVDIAGSKTRVVNPLIAFFDNQEEVAIKKKTVRQKSPAPSKRPSTPKAPAPATPKTSNTKAHLDHVLDRTLDGSSPKSKPQALHDLGLKLGGTGASGGRGDTSMPKVKASNILSRPNSPKSRAAPKKNIQTAAKQTSKGRSHQKNNRGEWVDNGTHITPTDSTVVVHDPVSRIELTIRDIQLLGSNGWLNDEVINVYTTLVLTRNQKRARQEGWPTCHITNTFFFSRLASMNAASQLSYNYESIRRWTMVVNVFEKDRMLFPINLGNTHWACAMIDLKHKRFEYFDSLGGSNSVILDLLARWLVDEAGDKRDGMELDVNHAAGWEYVQHEKSVPQQDNCNDCGVFTCKFIDCLSRGVEFDFTQSDMRDVRKQMRSEIMELKLKI